MASSHSHFLLFALLIASSLQVHARESRFFSKTTPYEQPNQVGEEQQQEFTPLSDFKVNTPNFTPLSDFKVNTPNFTPLSAFKENNPPSTFKETPSLSENQNGHGLYSHEPNQLPPTTTTTTTTIPTNDPENQATPIDYSSFMTVTNEYANKDLTSGYGMSDTRVLENGKYFYDLEKEARQNGFPYQKGTTGSGFEYPSYNYKGVENRYGGHGGDNRYGGYGGQNRYGSYGNENGYYQSNNYYKQGNQEEQDEFIP